MWLFNEAKDFARYVEEVLGASQCSQLLFFFGDQAEATTKQIASY